MMTCEHGQPIQPPATPGPLSRGAFKIALMVMAWASLAPVGWGQEPPQPPKEPAPPIPAPQREPDVNDLRYHPLVRDAVAAYPSFLKVDDAGRFAPERCMTPPPIPVRFSAAEENTPHGRKIYGVYAQDAKAYGYPATPKGWDPAPMAPDLALRIQGIEQILVKEAWKAEVLDELPTPPLKPGLRNWGRSELFPVQKDGRWWRGDVFFGLFLMIKPKQTDLRTDAGWIYATVAADRTTITGAGLMTSCMECHQTQPGRVFGLPEIPGQQPPR